MFLSLPIIYAAFGAAAMSLILRDNDDNDKEYDDFEFDVPCHDDCPDEMSTERTEPRAENIEISNSKFSQPFNYFTSFCDRINGKSSESSAVVFEDNVGNLSAWISSAPFLDVNITDVEHVALSLTDAMRSTPRLVVNYSCSDETKHKIEEIVNKICVLSPNERKGICNEKSKCC
jgi:hypothetical protein